MIYCIDTSSFIAAWQERYPVENFPAFWNKMDALSKAGRLKAPIDVLHETKKRSDELHSWLKARKAMFRELDDAVQIEAAQVLSQFPRLVGEKETSHLGRSFCYRACPSRGLADCDGRETYRQYAKAEYPHVCRQLGMTTVGHSASHKDREVGHRVKLEGRLRQDRDCPESGTTRLQQSWRCRTDQPQDTGRTARTSAWKRSARRMETHANSGKMAGYRAGTVDHFPLRFCGRRRSARDDRSPFRCEGSNGIPSDGLDDCASPLSGFAGFIETTS